MTNATSLGVKDEKVSCTYAGNAFPASLEFGLYKSIYNMCDKVHISIYNTCELLAVGWFSNHVIVRNRQNSHTHEVTHLGFQESIETILVLNLQPSGNK